VYGTGVLDGGSCSPDASLDGGRVYGGGSGNGVVCSPEAATGVGLLCSAPAHIAVISIDIICSAPVATIEYFSPQ